LLQVVGCLYSSDLFEEFFVRGHEGTFKPLCWFDIGGAIFPQHRKILYCKLHQDFYTTSLIVEVNARYSRVAH
jgi:hypothetical protein